MTTTAPVPPAPEAAAHAPEAMGPARVEFAHLRRRARTGIWIEMLGILGLLCVAYSIPTLLTDRFLRLEVVFRAALVLSFVAVVVVQVRRRLLGQLRVRLDDDEIALAVERRAPDVREALISSLQFDRSLRGPALAGDESRAMMVAVVADTNARLRSIPFTNALDKGRVRRFLGGLMASILFFVGWGIVDGGSLSTWARRNLLLGSVDWPRYTALAFVDAGEVIRVPQGDALTVRVATTGVIPEQVFLDYEFAGGETGSEPMSSTGDGEFVLTLETVLEAVVLRAEGGDALPVELRVAVVERPRIEDLTLTVDYPAYMEREPEAIPGTEGDVRVPRGSVLRIAGRSHKPLVDSFVSFGEGRKVQLQRSADGRSFTGEFRPENSGLLVVDVIDTDRLGAGTPPKFLLRVGDDKPPHVDFRLRGIGSLISSHARIPGDLKVKDDFGLRAIDASMRATEGDTSEQRPDSGAPLPEVPFENVVATYQETMVLNSLRYETPSAVDLRQWNPEPAENDKDNRIRPGMLVAVRYGATDNFGPGEPHHGYGEVMTFRVVTRERLHEDLRRRQVEQRDELEKIVEEHQAALLEFREMAETLLTNARPDEEGKVLARLRTLSRQQVALGRRAAFIAESYQRILWEYENNRLWDSPAVRQAEAKIPAPLEAVARDSFPANGRLVENFSGARTEDAKASSEEAYISIERRLLAVLTEMEHAATLAAILADLRSVIDIEDSVRQEVENRAQEAAESVLGPGKGTGRDGGNEKK